MSVHRMSNIGALIKAAAGTVPLSAAGTVNGAYIDRQDQASAVLVATTGAATGTPSAQTCDAKLQHSAASGSGFADVTDGAITQIAADNGLAYVDVDLTGLNRYIRVVTVLALTGGSSPTWPNAAVVILGGARAEPLA